MTPQQEAFCREYLVDLNAKQAAIRAGYSEKTAYSQGSRLLKHDEVQRAINAGKVKQVERIDITADMVLARLWQIGQCNNPAMQPVKALELCGKHLGMFTERMELETHEERRLVVSWAGSPEAQKAIEAQAETVVDAEVVEPAPTVTVAFNE